MDKCTPPQARRAVLAGDHLQLPPTVISEDAARRGLSRTLFERLQARAGACLLVRVCVYVVWWHTSVLRGRAGAAATPRAHTCPPPRSLAGAVGGGGE